MTDDQQLPNQASGAAPGTASAGDARRERKPTAENWHRAKLQLWMWRSHLERIMLGLHHFTPPTLRRGQWVRFIGNPDWVVASDQRPPAFGDYGQVVSRERAGRSACVLFIGKTILIRLGPDAVEALVGTPVGRPRDHLRRYLRKSAAWRRTERTRRRG